MAQMLLQTLHFFMPELQNPIPGELDDKISSIKLPDLS
jgi:hypothetical protein